MVAYLEPPPCTEFDPPCSLFESLPGAVLELGAGTGFLGLAMARLISSRRSDRDSKTLVLTDLPGVCPLLDRNRQQKIPEGLPGVNLMIEPLPWGDLHYGNVLANKLSSDAAGSAPLLSHIICSDLVYFPELLAPLLRTLLQISSPPFSTASQPVEIIISYMIRSLAKETAFWSAFGTWFDLSPVIYRQKDKSWRRFGDGEKDTSFIFVAKRRPETLLRPIPEEKDILKEGNDTFESLLLMNMTLDD